MKNGRFRIDPEPPVAGQPATITYTGSSCNVTWQVNGEPPVTVKIPPRVIEIPRVPGGKVIVVTDGMGGEQGEHEWPISEKSSS
jgi:hypothetical protein